VSRVTLLEWPVGAGAPALRQDEALSGVYLRTRQVIRLLDAPDSTPDIAAVVPLRDRPERVVRPNGHDLLCSVSLRRPGDRTPDEDGDADDEEDAHEHVFATLANTYSAVVAGGPAGVIPATKASRAKEPP